MKEHISFVSRWSFSKALMFPTPTTPVLLVEEFLSGAKTYGLSFLGKKMTCPEIRSNLGSLEGVVGNMAVAEGAYIIDQREVPNQIGHDAFITGPVLNILLPPLTIERITFRKKAFKTLDEAMKFPSTILPLTEVSMDIYAAYWKGLGARIGRKFKGKVKWETNLNPSLN